MSKGWIWVLALLVFGGVSNSVWAADAQNEAKLKELEEKIRGTFQQFRFEYAGPTPIPGVFQLVSANGRVTYYYEGEEDHEDVIIIGRMYSAEGKDLTEAEIQKRVKTRVKGLPLDKAVVLGPEGGIPLIEFTDPNCPFCRKYDGFIEGLDQDVRRYIFFEPAIHVEARPKMIHILCAEDQAVAFRQVYDGQIAKEELKACAEGETLLQEHAEVSKMMGVSVTPLIIAGKEVIKGFRKDAILAYLARAAK